MNALRIVLPLACLLLVACSDDDSPTVDVVGDAPLSDPADEERLTRFGNADAFYAALREALRRQWLGGDVVVPFEDVAVDFAEADSADGATEDAGPAGDVTTTNVQEAGVDEADRVKSDGESLFVLTSRETWLWPPFEPAPLEEPEPEPVGNRSSYLPPTDFDTRLRVLALEPEAPEAREVADLELDLGGRRADGMYLHQGGGANSLYVISNGLPGYWNFWGEPGAFGEVDGLIRRVDVGNPANVSARERIAIDGQIVSSRRIGDRLFVATRYYPRLPNIDPYAVSETEWEQAVAAADLERVLPRYRVDGGDGTRLFDPADCFVAEDALDDAYATPDIISLSVFELGDFTLADTACFLGSTETLYASTEAVYLATTRWQYSAFPQPIDDASEDLFFEDPRTDTDLHRFAIDAAALRYTGSARVRGHLGWNTERKPWRLSERDGYLRVATFNDRISPDTSPVLMSVLEVGSDDLALVSTLPNPSNPAFIGKPGEQLYASRFVGDRAYLVTFRQTDPLYIVDLSDPRAPRVAGELEIEGYSDYLQPIGENWVLGIGRDAVAAPDGFGDGRGALTLGVKLALFDVADPANPLEYQSITIGQRGTDAAALYNHRAITVQPANGSRPTRVAFGIDVAGRPGPGERPAPADAGAFYSWNFTGLHGFEVRDGADAGIVTVPPMIVARAAEGDLNPGWYVTDDRSVFVGDAVYYIYGSDVFAAAWPALDNYTGPR